MYFTYETLLQYVIERQSVTVSVMQISNLRQELRKETGGRYMNSQIFDDRTIHNYGIHFSLIFHKLRF